MKKVPLPAQLIAASANLKKHITALYFLDEIGEMDLNMQAKLLRALQEKEITRIGSNEIVKINVRILVATHRNLQEEISKGNFSRRFILPFIWFANCIATIKRPGK